MSRGPAPPRALRPMGDAAFLLAADDARQARGLAAAIAEARLAGVVDVVGGLRSVVVSIDPRHGDPLALAERLARVEARPEAPERTRTLTLPVVLDGPDLEEVCGRCRTDPPTLADWLAGAELEVAMMGFSPGFGYLSGLPGPLQGLPRRTAPRSVVPAGSLALAGDLAALYPRASPGGWQLIGRTWEPLFDPYHPPYARLRAGDRVRLVPTDPPAPPPGRPVDGGRPLLVAPPGSHPTWRVVEPGLQTTVQDGGRHGFAHLGVPGAGPADPVSHQLANRLVANRPTAAALEITALGPTLECLSASYVAMVGGCAPWFLDGHEVPAGRVVPVAAGQLLRVGATATGLRTYLGVAGGVAVPEVLGSRATDLLSGLGPGPLQTGDELGAERAVPSSRLADHLAGALGAAEELAGGPPGSPDPRVRTLRVLPGPHTEWFPPATLDGLPRRCFAVDATSDRVGLRLRALEAPLARQSGELASQGMVTGAVQLPPDGQPVVLGPDHATTGGYPVLAVVIAADRWRLGQCRPGDRVRLEPVDRPEAARALAALERAVAAEVVGTYPVITGSG